MERALEWLLGLEQIRLGRDAPIRLMFSANPPMWLMFFCGLIAVTWIVILYRRERCTARRSVVLAALRVSLVALVAAMLCGPSLVLQQEHVEPARVVLLVDTSHSMSRAERYDDEELAASVADGAGVAELEKLRDYRRLDLVKRALLKDQGAALSAILTHNGIQLSTFAQSVETRAFAGSASGLDGLMGRLADLVPDGVSTDLAGALHDVLDDSRGRRLAAVILATDGQTTHPTSLKDALDLARGRRIPIVPIRLGSTVRPRDVEVETIVSDRSVFVSDIVSIDVPVTVSGMTEPCTITARLIDEATGEIVTSAEATVQAGQSQATIALHLKPAQAGRYRYRVEVPPLPKEWQTDNNDTYVDLVVRDNRLRVLFVEGYPRYEYRYLKNALLREATIELSVVLLEADRQFVQEGTEPVRGFPKTPEALSRFDVVLFGDVDPRAGWLTEAQMRMLLDFVGNEGGGFGLIAGERSAPHRFAGTPLEKVIPVRIDRAFLGDSGRSLTSGFHLQVTREGRRSRLFRSGDALESVPGASATTPGDQFDQLPELFWFARTLGPKPGASVLAVHPTARTLLGPMPIAVSGRYGAGKIFFQGTDDTWRWRRHTGELLHDTYWVQVVRDLMPSSGAGGDRRYVIRTDRRRYAYGAPVRTQVEVFDPALLGLHPETVEITVDELVPANRKNADASTQRGVGSTVGTFKARRVGQGSGLFEGTYVPPRAGSFVLQANAMPRRPGERAATATLRVGVPDPEARNPEADHGVLERIADATDGNVIGMDQLVARFAEIPDRSVRIPADVVESLWDSWLAVAAFGLLITMEWGLRKAFGLL